MRTPVVLVAAGNRPATVLDGREVYETVDVSEISTDFAKDPQARDTPVRIDMQAHVREHRVVANVEKVVCIAAHVRLRDQLDPAVFRHVAVADAALERDLRRVVARKKTRIDVEPVNHPGNTEAYDAVIVPGLALAAAFPAVHPLAVVIVAVFDEHRFGRVDQALLGPEEFVSGESDSRPEPRLLETDPLVELLRHRALSIASSRMRAIL